MFTQQNNKSRDQTDSHKDIYHREYLPRISLRSEVAVADRRQRDDREIQRIQRPPAFDARIKDRPDADHNNHPNEQRTELFIF